MSARILYGLAGTALLISALKDTKKTSMALRKGWMAFNGILPQLVAIILLVGILIALLRPEVLSRLLGSESGWYGVLLSSLVGVVTFPLEASYFGKRVAIARNFTAYGFALLVALVMGLVVPL